MIMNMRNSAESVREVYSGAVDQPLISLRDVAVCYRKRSALLTRPKRFWALKGVTLDVFRGETLGVIGRNGAGKSTLLRILAGILLPDKGTVIRDKSRATLLSLQVGFIPGLSGRENIILSGMLLGCSRRQMQSRLDSIVEFAELADFIDEPLRSYSSGMCARLGFSIAYHVDPEIVLIDETLSVGDAAFALKSSAAIRVRILSNRTVVLVSHQAKKIEELCDRAVWIDVGFSRLTGEAGEVVHAYTESILREQGRKGVKV